MQTLVAAISVSMDRMPSRREMGRQCLKEKVGPRRTPLLWVEVADSCVHSLKEGFRINMEVDEKAMCCRVESEKLNERGPKMKVHLVRS